MFLYTQPKATSGHSWYLTSFVILSFFCLPFATDFIFLKTLFSIFLFSSNEDTLLFLIICFAKGDCLYSDYKEHFSDLNIINCYI